MNEEKGESPMTRFEFEMHKEGAKIGEKWVLDWLRELGRGGEALANAYAEEQLSQIEDFNRGTQPAAMKITQGRRRERLIEKLGLR